MGSAVEGVEASFAEVVATLKGRLSGDAIERAPDPVNRFRVNHKIRSEA